MASLDVDSSGPLPPALLADARRQLTDLRATTDASALGPALGLTAKVVAAALAQVRSQCSAQGVCHDDDRPASADDVQAACLLASAGCEKLSAWCGSSNAAGSNVASGDGFECVAAAVQEMAPAVFQLAALVLTDAHACRLLGAAHSVAAEHMQGAVKALAQQLPPLLAEQQRRGVPGGVPGDAVGGLRGAARGCAAHLRALATAVAAVLSDPQSPNVPSQLRSFSVLNTAWASIIRLVTQLPAGDAAMVFSARDQCDILSCALTQLRGAVQRMSAKCDSNSLRIVKFWLQCVVKLVCSWDGAAARGCWALLLETTLELYTQSLHIAGCSAPGESAQHVQELVLPRMAACLLATVSHQGLQPTEVEARLQSIMRPSLQQQQQQQHAGVMMALDLLQRGANMGLALAQLTAQTLLPWAVQQTSSTTAGPVLNDKGDGMHCHVVRSCLAFVFGVGAHPDVWHLALSQLHTLVLSPHVLISHTADAVLRALGEQLPPELAVEDMRAAGQLMSASAALDALNSCTSSPGTDLLMARCCSLLGACPPHIKAQAAMDLLDGRTAADSTSEAAASAVCWSVVCLAAPEAVDRAYAAAQLAHWTRTAHEALALAGNPAVLPEERRYVQLHLAWLLGCIGQAAALFSPQHQHLAREELGGACGVLMEALHCALDQATHPTGEGRPPYLTPALEALAAMGGWMTHDALRSVLARLRALSADGPDALHLARALAHMGPACAQPQELFHVLLCSSRWPVAQAAMQSLVCYCRRSPGAALTELVPLGMRTADGTAAKPEFVQMYASHMAREPGAQATSTFRETHPVLLEQHIGILAANPPAAAFPRPRDPDAALAATRAYLNAQQASEQAACAAVHKGTTALGQVLAPLVADTQRNITALMTALGPLEASLQALIAAASQGRMQAQPQDVLLLQRTGSSLAGDVASVVSRLRGVQDHVATLRP